MSIWFGFVIVGAIMGAFGNALPTPWGLIPGLLGAGLCIYGGWRQKKLSDPYALHFKPAGWQRVGAGWRISIPVVLHEKGARPSIRVEMLTPADDYAEVMADVETSRIGDVRVDIGAAPFAGRIIIK